MFPYVNINFFRVLDGTEDVLNDSFGLMLLAAVPFDCYNARYISLGTTISYILSIYANTLVIVFVLNGCSCNKWNMKLLF